MVAETHLDILIHPLVLLNISDYYTRVSTRAQPQKSHLAGICLGTQEGRQVAIETTFEALLSADSDGNQIDAAFLEQKLDQYKQVFPKLEVMAWYTIGNTPGQWESSVQTFLSTRFESPLLLMLDPAELDRVHEKNVSDLPLKVFEYPMEVVSEIQEAEATSGQGFLNLAWRLETGEAERIAVDHITKAQADVGANNDLTASETSLLSQYNAQANAVKILSSRIALLRAYVQDVKDGKVAADHELLRRIQALTQRLPVMKSPSFDYESQIEHGDVLLTQHLGNLMNGSKALEDLIAAYAAATPKDAGKRALAI